MKKLITPLVIKLHSNTEKELQLNEEERRYFDFTPFGKS